MVVIIVVKASKIEYSLDKAQEDNPLYLVNSLRYNKQRTTFIITNKERRILNFSMRSIPQKALMEGMKTLILIIAVSNSTSYVFGLKWKQLLYWKV